MGMYAIAKVFYGYSWTEEERLFKDDDDDQEWVDRLLKKRGYVNPWDSRPDFYTTRWGFEEEQRRSLKWAEENKKELDEYSKVTEAVVEEFDCDIGHHGYEYGSTYLLANDSEQSVECGDQEQLKAVSIPLVLCDSWGERIEHFIKELGIKKPKGQKVPEWWLVASYG